jgi:hypothetical protein
LASVGRGTNALSQLRIVAISATAKYAKRVDYEYEREGTANIVMTAFPDASVRGRKTLRRYPDTACGNIRWSSDVNGTQRGIDWQMKIDDARCKLTSVYLKTKLRRSTRALNRKFWFIC